jgi:hypothetical protein
MKIITSGELAAIERGMCESISRRKVLSKLISEYTITLDLNLTLKSVNAANKVLRSGLIRSNGRGEANELARLYLSLKELPFLLYCYSTNWRSGVLFYTVMLNNGYERGSFSKAYYEDFAKYTQDRVMPSLVALGGAMSYPGFDMPEARRIDKVISHVKQYGSSSLTFPRMEKDETGVIRLKQMYSGFIPSLGLDYSKFSIDDIKNDTILRKN